ncbi:MAG TPA: XRE family transcriptional regulator [Clostridiales bacterium]|nr:XRE family transcriptional regulator [Clostridiales bacterium]
MDQYVTGAAIKRLRQNKKLTQQELAQLLSVSAKTVSKWETGRGYPDITLLEPIARALDVSITELLAGSPVLNENVSANMLRSVFSVCPVCGNVVHSMGEAVVSCHGVPLAPCEPEVPDDKHRISVERCEDEYFVRIDHPMTKSHYISFIAAVSCDGLQLKKLYPEGGAAARFKLAGVERLYFYCNRDGLFCLSMKNRQHQ